MNFVRINGIAIVLGLSLFGTAVNAQEGSTSAMPRQHVSSGPPREIVHNSLNRIPDPFAVPLPGDSQFVMGYQSQYASGGPQTFLRLKSKHTAPELMSWYEQTLRSIGWNCNNVKPSGTNSNSILTATKFGGTCVITFASDVSQGSTVMISYSQPRGENR